MTKQSNSTAAEVLEINSRQRTFIRYLTAILIDLMVLNLFEEYWDAVIIPSFTISLLAAILLQVLLRMTIHVEHRIAARYKDVPGAGATFKRILYTWLVLFGSKFVILEVLSITFGNSVQFTGAFHGIVALIVVLLTMVAAEEVVARYTRYLGVRHSPAKTS